MNFRLFCIFSLFIFNVIIHNLVEKSNVKVPDFRWMKTICTPGYGFWSNDLNNARYYDTRVAPYMQNMICWVYHNEIRFSQPFLPYEILVFLDIFVFVVGLFFF